MKRKHGKFEKISEMSPGTMNFLERDSPVEFDGDHATMS